MADQVTADFPLLLEEYEQQARAALGPLYDRILADVRDRYRHDVYPLVDPVWEGELAGAVSGIQAEVVADVGGRVAADFGNDDGEWAPEGMTNYLAVVTAGIAAGAVGRLRDRLPGPDAAPQQLTTSVVGEALADLAESAKGEIKGIGRALVMSASNIAAKDAAERTGATHKVWRTRATGDTRESHADLNGDRVPIRGLFHNGMSHPHGGGPPEETANCNCYLVLEREEVTDAG